MTEEELYVIKRVKVQGVWDLMDYDLHFTDSRIVAIHAKIRPFSGMSIESKRIESKRKESEAAQSLSFDERIGLDKKNFAIPYVEVEKARLSRSRLSWSTYKVKANKMEKEFMLTKWQFGQLLSSLPSITILSDKTEYPKI